MTAHAVSFSYSPSPPTAMGENSATSRTTEATLQSVSNADRELVATTTSCSGQFFECSRCHQRFGRADHLSRHVRTHTLEKPYRCTFCGKLFARSDLLKRHVCLHLEELSEAGNSPNKSSGIGSRVSRACKECSATKLKCSEEKPCHRCVSKGILCESASSRPYRHATTDEASTVAEGNEERETSNLPETKAIPPSRSCARRHSLPNCVSSSSQQSINLCPGTQAESMFPSLVMNGEINDSIMVATCSSNDPETSVDMANLSSEMNLPGQSDIPGAVDTVATDFGAFLKDLLLDPHGGEANSTNIRGDPFSQNWDEYMAVDENATKFDISFEALNYDADLYSYVLEGDSVDQTGASPEKDAIACGAKAFETSLWHWIPGPGDYGTADEAHLSISHALTNKPISVPEPHKSLQENLFAIKDRDRALAIILTLCDRSNAPSIAASFPSCNILEKLIYLFLRHQSTDSLSWFHVPTFRASSTREELLLGMIACGASLAPMKVFHKLGTALPNILFNAWDNDNKLSRDLQLLQTFAIFLKIWFWSGGQRKMEMAEGFTQPVITIIRRSGMLRRTSYNDIIPNESDSHSELERKWRLWVEKESRIRLVHLMFVHDAQASMTLFVNPLLSCADLDLPLPSDNDLWFAGTATEWKTRILSRGFDQKQRISLSECIRSVFNKGSLPAVRDPACALLHTLYGLSGLIWEYRQAHHMLRMGDFHYGHDGLALTSRFEALSRALHVLRDAVTTYEEDKMLSDSGTWIPELLTILEFNSAALNAPLRSLPIFAGKDGELESQHVYPMLQEWTQSREARQAMWHAGQLYKSARNLPTHQIKGFQAVAIYQASLLFWVYGIIIGGRNQREGVSTSNPFKPVVLLDAEMTPHVKQFIACGEGIPGIRDLDSQGDISSKATALHNPAAMMSIAIRIMRSQEESSTQFMPATGRVIPILVNSLAQLMTNLGRAARTVGFG
ncbi:hypothetical protein EDB80DRAFT_842197 [Ilyonectria destructans]|nr:hypothetical protein EDB80DRAFT_842197 [Ilyonectria destructans]